MSVSIVKLVMVGGIHVTESTESKKSIPHPSGPQTWGIELYVFGHILYWRVQHMFQFPDDKFCERVYFSRHRCFSRQPIKEVN